MEAKSIFLRVEEASCSRSNCGYIFPTTAFIGKDFEQIVDIFKVQWKYSCICAKKRPNFYLLNNLFNISRTRGSLVEGKIRFLKPCI